MSEPINLTSGIATQVSGESGIETSVQMESGFATQVNVESGILPILNLDSDIRFTWAIEPVSVITQTLSLIASIPALIVDTLSPILVPTSSLTLASSVPALTVDISTYTSKLESIEPTSLLAHYIMNETGGSTCEDNLTNYDGAYVGSPSFGHTGIGDGETCIYVDATAEYANLLSSGLYAAMDMDEFTIAGWVQGQLTNWWGSVNARDIFHLTAASPFRQVNMMKHATVDWFQFEIVHNDVDSYEWERSAPSPVPGDTDWFHVAITVSLAADAMKYYIDGSQFGATDPVSDSWYTTGGPTGVTNFRIGAFSNISEAYLAHWAFWNTPLSAADIADLATV
jgi:hypothetical protein